MHTRHEYMRTMAHDGNLRQGAASETGLSDEVQRETGSSTVYNYMLSYMVKLQAAFGLTSITTPLLVLTRVYGDFRFREFQREWLQVQAEVLETSMQDLQTRLAQAQQELVLKRQTVEGLTHKFDRQVGLVLIPEAALNLL
jgi:hypothetical protein